MYQLRYRRYNLFITSILYEQINCYLYYYIVKTRSRLYMPYSISSDEESLFTALQRLFQVSSSLLDIDVYFHHVPHRLIDFG